MINVLSAGQTGQVKSGCRSARVRVSISLQKTTLSCNFPNVYNIHICIRLYKLQSTKQIDTVLKTYMCLYKNEYIKKYNPHQVAPIPSSSVYRIRNSSNTEIQPESRKSNAVFHPRPTFGCEVDSILANGINDRSSTSHNPLEPVSHLLLAITFLILA